MTISNSADGKPASLSPWSLSFESWRHQDAAFQANSVSLIGNFDIEVSALLHAEIGLLKETEAKLIIKVCKPIPRFFFTGLSRKCRPSAEGGRRCLAEGLCVGGMELLGEVDLHHVTRGGCRSPHVTIQTHKYD